MKSYIGTVARSLWSSSSNDKKRKDQLGKITGQEMALVAAYKTTNRRGRRSIRNKALDNAADDTVDLDFVGVEAQNDIKTRAKRGLFCDRECRVEKLRTYMSDISGLTKTASEIATKKIEGVVKIDSELKGAIAGARKEVSLRSKQLNDFEREQDDLIKKITGSSPFQNIP